LNDLILGNLKGEARYWFQLEKTNISSMGEFIVKFKVQFHGTKYDNLIAKELGTNNYRDFGHISPFEYLVNTVSRAVNLKIRVKATLQKAIEE
jgi:hypothetical protein